MKLHKKSILFYRANKDAISESDKFQETYVAAVNSPISSVATPDVATCPPPTTVSKPTDDLASVIASVSSSRSTSEYSETVVIVSANFVGVQNFPTGVGYPNNDMYPWKLLAGRKSRGPYQFVCANANCYGQKNLHKSKTELKNKSKNPNMPINVKYSKRHSCSIGPKIDNIAFSSYHHTKGIKEKMEGLERILDQQLENEGTEGISNKKERYVKEQTIHEEGKCRDSQHEHGIISKSNVNNQETLNHSNISSPETTKEHQPTNIENNAFGELPEVTNNESDPNDNSFDDICNGAETWSEWNLTNTQEEWEPRVECETISAEPVNDDPYSRIRIDSSIRESSPDMFESSQNVESPVHIENDAFGELPEVTNNESDPNDNSFDDICNGAETWSV